MKRIILILGLLFAGIAAMSQDDPLPVELSKFDVEANGNLVAIFFTTETEDNNAYFEIQHSLNGRDFGVVGVVRGNGTTEAPIDYYYEHKYPAKGVNYYRLRQVDFDGQFEYSDIESLDFQNHNREQITIYPIPSDGEITIISSEFWSNILIYDIQGRMVRNIVFRDVESVRVHVTDISDLSPGSYSVVLVSQNGEIHTRRIIKK